jgi:4-amino-4-deoxychorismate lyase
LHSFEFWENAVSDFEPEFRVIETLRWTVQTGPQRLERHFARMAKTCSDLAITFPEAELRAQVRTLKASHDLRLRLTVDPSGQAAIEHWPLNAMSGPWVASISAHRLKSADPWLTRKTTRRDLYDEARQALPADQDEWLFLNERDELCEGTITNIFVKQGDVLKTPPVSCGLLPGVLRAEVLETGQAVEVVLTLEDLTTADVIFCGNSLRGLIPVKFKP